MRWLWSVLWNGGPSRARVQGEGGEKVEHEICGDM